MRPRSLVALVVLLTTTLFTGIANAIPIIPGAVGYGLDIVAGSGRHLDPPSTTVIKVTNTNATGAGSLHACISAVGPRVCVFEVSGTIDLTGYMQNLVITNPYITIAGQTAPSPGITIRGGGLAIRAGNVLVQHIRIRPGNENCNPTEGSCDNRDAILIGASGQPVNGVVIDHVSTSWSVDESVSVWRDQPIDLGYITVRRSIIAESLTWGHSKGVHGFGLIVGRGGHHVSIIENLMAHNVARNPLIRDTWNDAVVVNNLIYNPANRGIEFGGPGEPKRGSAVGNVLILGPSTYGTV